METIQKTLTGLAPVLFLLLLLAVAGMAYGYFRVLKRMGTIRDRFQQLLEGVRGDDLERLLDLHFKERQQVMIELSALSSRLQELEDRSFGAMRHMGLVRFDAFDDVSGSQSFALALFDDRGDGAVISGLVGRADCRVYCKSLQSWRSERELSQEERRAIDMAKSTGPKSIVS